MKISKQRLKEIIREELYRDDDAMRGATRPGAGIEDYPEPEEDLSSPSEEAMTVTRPFLAMTDEFAQYLRDNEIPPNYQAIKQHFLDLGLAPGHAGIYALYAAESFGLEEGWGWRDDDDDKPEGYPMTNKQKRAEIGMPEEEPLRLSRPKHDPLDRSPRGIRNRRRLQGKGIKNYPLDK